MNVTGDCMRYSGWGDSSDETRSSGVELRLDSPCTPDWWLIQSSGVSSESDSSPSSLAAWNSEERSFDGP